MASHTGSESNTELKWSNLTLDILFYRRICRRMFVGGFMSYLHICVCLHIVVYNTYCVVLFSFVCLSLLYPMSPVSLCCVLFVLVFCTLCCQFLCVVFCFSSSCVPYVTSFSRLSNFDCPFDILWLLYISRV